MKKRFISTVSVILAVMLALCSLTLSASAAGGISYSFEGSNAGDRGYAQGTIRVSADSSSGGSYTLYWADDSAALSGFDPICTLNVAASSSASFNMPAYTVIPAQATKVIGFRGSVPSGMSVSSAAAVYDIPENKRLNRSKDDMLYSFASYSDTHISCNDSTAVSKYPYDEQKLTDAFNAAADRGVDFIITTGDNVNNERDDSKGGSNPFYAEEWNTYLKILADSNYVNPVYEAIGNHELWCYDHDSANLVKGMDWKTGSDYFCTVTGLDSTEAALDSGKAYYEVTEPTTGDHFLFMALEGGFYTNMNDEFSDEQLSRLDSKLTQYETDGKNIFIMEHCNIKYWGAGDQLDNPIYDLGLESGCQATAKLKALLQKHKSAVMITGHTHFKLDLQLNYSTNNQTSATIMHNSSVGGVRNILNRTTRVNDTTRELSEGYFVEVYDNATIFYGANLYYNKINPSTSYIIPQTTSSIKPKPTQPTQATQTPEPECIYGDADGDEIVTIMDVTVIQRWLLGAWELDGDAILRAAVSGEDELSIVDATLIQRWLLGIIDVFPAESVTPIYKAPETPVLTREKGSEIADTGADLDALRSQAKAALDKYWLLASYDQYQALKKAYRLNYGYDQLSSDYSAFSSIAAKYYPSDYITVYFTNNVGWAKGSVKAYCTAGHGKDKNAAWPGVSMKEEKSNKYGEPVYSITLPRAKYNFIIFTNGSEQTVDLALGVTENQGFYYNSSLGKDSSGKYRCTSYKYDPATS